MLDRWRRKVVPAINARLISSVRRRFQTLTFLSSPPQWNRFFGAESEQPELIGGEPQFYHHIF